MDTEVKLAAIVKESYGLILCFYTYLPVWVLAFDFSLFGFYLFT